jgi:hypothetical protein
VPIKRTERGSELSHCLLVLVFSFLCSRYHQPSRSFALVVSGFVVCLPLLVMARLKQTAHAHEGDVSLEGADAAAHELAEVLSALNQDVLEVTTPRSREGSEVETEDSGNEGGSESSTSEASDSESDAAWKAKLATATAAGLTFDFSPSIVVRGQIRVMEDLGYFAKGDGRAPGVEMMLEPHIDEVVVFEDFFACGLYMPLHRLW